MSDTVCRSEVVVKVGDTLRLIAARIFGDASLWYVIAEENGLSNPDELLTVGQALRIPNDVVSLSNTSSSFKPFNVAEAIGDTTPTQPLPPAPQAKKGCGVLGQVLMVVVSIVVTVYTAGAAAGLLAPNTTIAGSAAGATLGNAGAWAAGSAVLGGTAGASGAIVAAAGLGGAVGSIASQAVGIATGLQDGFDWKGVALGAVGAGVTAGLGGSAAWRGVLDQADSFAPLASERCQCSVIRLRVRKIGRLQEEVRFRTTIVFQRLNQSGGRSAEPSGQLTRIGKFQLGGMVEDQCAEFGVLSLPALR